MTEYRESPGYAELLLGPGDFFGQTVNAFKKPVDANRKVNYNNVNVNNYNG